MFYYYWTEYERITQKRYKNISSYSFLIQISKIECLPPTNILTKTTKILGWAIAVGQQISLSPFLKKCNWIVNIRTVRLLTTVLKRVTPTARLRLQKQYNETLTTLCTLYRVHRSSDFASLQFP